MKKNLVSGIIMTDWYCEKCPDNNQQDCGEWIESDSDLDPIRNHPRFQKALKELD